MTRRRRPQNTNAQSARSATSDANISFATLVHIRQNGLTSALTAMGRFSERMS